MAFLSKKTKMPKKSTHNTKDLEFMMEVTGVPGENNQLNYNVSQ